MTAAEAAGAAAGEGARDDPRGAGQPTRGFRDRPEATTRSLAAAYICDHLLGSSDEGEAVSFQGELAAVRAFYGACIEAVRRTVPRRDRVLAIKVLRIEKQAAIREITERRRRESASRRAADLLRRPPRDPNPAK